MIMELCFWNLCFSMLESSGQVLRIVIRAICLPLDSSNWYQMHASSLVQISKRARYEDLQMYAWRSAGVTLLVPGFREFSIIKL